MKKTIPSMCQIPASHTVSGFSLLEVLVALLILSIGLLGIAGMQATSKRTNFEALQRTTAVMLANDIIERMRANTGQVSTYTDSDTGRAISEGDLSAPAPDCTPGFSCTPAQIAALDLYQWQEAISGAGETKDGANTGGLVTPTGCLDAGPNDNEVIVTIAWRGMTELISANPSACGTALGDFRRLLQVSTVIF